MEVSQKTALTNKACTLKVRDVSATDIVKTRGFAPTTGQDTFLQKASVQTWTVTGLFDTEVGKKVFQVMEDSIDIMKSPSASQ